MLFQNKIVTINLFVVLPHSPLSITTLNFHCTKLLACLLRLQVQRHLVFFEKETFFCLQFIASHQSQVVLFYGASCQRFYKWRQKT